MESYHSGYFYKARRDELNWPLVIIRGASNTKQGIVEEYISKEEFPPASPSSPPSSKQPSSHTSKANT